MKELNIRIAGQAGQGVATIGEALCRVFKKARLYVYANQDYMSRVRGGNNFFQLRVSDKRLYCPVESPDIVVALDSKSVDLHGPVVSDNGIMVLDKAKFNSPENSNKFFDVPFYELANKTGGNDIYINTACCGVVVGLTALGFEYIEEVIKDIFADKGEDIIAKNILAARAGYDFSRGNFKAQNFDLTRGAAGNTLLINGNQAIALGAIKAGCKFYSGYPMTPSTTIMDTMAHFCDKFGIVVEQAEDEIAAINMVIGASFAGVRSMTATSGGGFCLMVEGVSLSAMTETPIVTVLAQRPAPATGFPTRTEQADLDFLIHAGHGEFARIVYSPGTIEEAFYLTTKAFNMAEKYQVPVFIMTDQHLADSLMNVEPFDLLKVQPQRYVLSKEDSKNITGYKRYKLTPSGISPLAVPSWINDVIYADSDEHDEDGHITEDADIRVKMVEKRFYKKISGITQEIESPVVFNIDKARTVLLGFGSTYGVIKEAAETLHDKNIGFVHLPQVWPFPALEVSLLLKDKENIITVENNAGAQLAGLLRRETGIKANSSILRYDGRPFSLKSLVKRVENGN